MPALGWTSGGNVQVPENNSPPYMLSASTDFEVMRRRRGDISDGKPEHPTFVSYVAYVGVEQEEMVIKCREGAAVCSGEYLNFCSSPKDVR